MFDGIITPIVTPFHRDEEQSINYEATKQLIDHLIARALRESSSLEATESFM